MGPASVRRDPWPLVGVACALAFLLLAALILRGGGLTFDERLGSAIRALPVPVGLWEACTWFGGPALPPVAGALIVGALLSGRVRLAVVVGATLLVAVLFADTVKEYVARPRPADPLVPTSGYSFPSGHALESTATYGLVALLVWRARLAPRMRRVTVVAGVAIPLVVGLSRVALDAHWPTDVLAGWLAGAALVATAATLIDRMAAMTPDVPPPVRSRAPQGDQRSPEPSSYSRASLVAGAAPTVRPRPEPMRRRRGRARRG